MKQLSHIWFLSQKRILLLISPLLWFWLCGQKSAAGNFELSDLSATYDAPAVIPTSFYVGVGFAISAAVGGFFGLRFYRAKMEELEQIRIKREQTDMTLHTLYESLKMSEDEVELVHRLGNKREAEEILCETSKFIQNELADRRGQPGHQTECFLKASRLQIR